MEKVFYEIFVIMPKYHFSSHGWVNLELFAKCGFSIKFGLKIFCDYLGYLEGDE